MLKVTPGTPLSREQQRKMDLVDLIEAITYVVCQDSPVTFKSFFRIVSENRVLASKLMGVLSSSGSVEIRELMEFIKQATINQGLKLSKEYENRVRKVFQEHLGENKQSMNFEEFKSCFDKKAFKEDFFVKRMFDIFDCSDSGEISLTDFVETTQQFAKDDDNSKISFLFKLYDREDKGILTEENLLEVLRAMMKENEMEIDEEELEHLANVLFEDGCAEGRSFLTLNDFKQQLERHPGLTRNLSIMITNWLVPKEEKTKSRSEKLTEKLPKQVFTRDFWNNSQTTWILFVVLANIAIMAERVYFFRNFSMLNGFIPNVFWLVSRACGRALIFNSVVILILVMRNAITFMRRLGLGAFLPLDHVIYVHKVTGTLIFFQALAHSIAHLCNFAFNIKPNPIRFIQLNYQYWTDHYGKDFFKAQMEGEVYDLPPGCTLVDRNHSRAEYCLENSFPDADEPGPAAWNGTWLCQQCDLTVGRGIGDHLTGPWTYHEWMLTKRPHMLGMVQGLANPTGLTLMTIMFFIFISSLPCIRRRGHFEVFYFSHLLYWAYFPLIILHAPICWKWIAVPGSVWLIDKFARMANVNFGKGKTTIKAGVILPSKVTNLVINRPSSFNFNVGDWVFVNIPAVASHEWHPFTISSAPEVGDQITLHIQGVGGWTKSLHKLIKEEYERQAKGTKRERSGMERIQETIMKKYREVRRQDADELLENEEGTFRQISKRLATNSDPGNQVGEKKLLRKNVSDHILKERTTKGGSVAFGGPTRYFTIPKPDIVEYETEEGKKLNQVVVERQGSKDSEAPKLEKPLEIYLDGPFGSPSSNIYRAEHAVLICTGIGVTPFAAILQSIICRWLQIKTTCPNCNFSWGNKIEGNMFNLKKVDFIWINRDQKSFEWFVNLLSQLEAEQQEQGGEMNRFLDMHMYVTSALQKTDMKAVALQMAFDLVYEKEHRDLVTGLKSRTHAGRPNWNRVFTQLREEKKGKVTVFYCGNPLAGRIIKEHCRKFDFNFRKEVF